MSLGHVMHTIRHFCEQLSIKEKTFQACPVENAHAVLFHKQIQILSSEMGADFTLSVEKDLVGPP